MDNILIDDVQNIENQLELMLTKISQLKDNEISNSLLKLNEELASLNPNKYKPSKILSLIPFMGNPLNRYLKKFQSAKSVVDDSLQGLQNGAKILKDDNIVLLSDMEYYKNRAIMLQRKGVVFEKIIDVISKNLERFSPKERMFYENNLALNLRKKCRSIYEILLVTQ